ncbi:hypothetical protein Tco_0255633 [Tanacetum coccineum]
MVVVCAEKTSGDDDLLLRLEGCGSGICTAGGGGVDYGVSGLMWVEKNGNGFGVSMFCGGEMCSGVGGVEYGSVYSGFAAALAVLVTGASQSRQLESRKSLTAELFDVDYERISIVTVNTKEYHSDVLAEAQG